MKIVLTAFQKKLWGKPFEVPDNIGLEFHLPMPMDILVYDSKRNMQTPVDAIMKRATFRATNGFYSLKDFGMKPAKDENDSVMEYTLVDIS